MIKTPDFLRKMIKSDTYANKDNTNFHETNGQIEKGDKTEKTLNDRYEYKGFGFSNPINVNKNQIAVFDGEKLTIYQDDKKIDSWSGISGRPGYQLPVDQVFKSTGPLPEGVYVAKQSDYQERKDYGFVKQQTSWPGGHRSWGDSRVWLEPSKQTNAFGRSGFSVHGGKIPGSAGCIDLTSKVDAFSDWFKNNGKDIIIYVKY